MRIGIDARELCGHSTGVGRYLSGLLQQWSTSDEARRHEFFLYAHEPLTVLLDARHFPSHVVSGGRGTRWEQQLLLPAIKRDHLDVFFAPGYTAPLFTRIPLVVAIHDVSFAAHPEWFSAREGLRRRLVTRRAAKAAKTITTLSEFSKRELIELLGIPADKIHIIRPGITAAGEGLRLSGPGIAHGMTPTPLAAPTPASETRPMKVLYVGSIFNRRHVPDLIRAFAQVARKHPEVTLDLVGDDRSYPRQDIAGAINREQMDGRIRWHQYVTDSELIELYASARAFAFLSEYEGLGLTPLEALASGVPSVLLDTPIARESCGEAATYVQQDDVRGTAAAIERLLFDEPARQNVLSAAPTVLARYDWKLAAAQTLAVLEEAT